MPRFPKFLATAIGSMPHSDVQKAIDIAMSAVPEAPIWPQLPRTGVREHMEPQYSEGMPRVVIDDDAQRMYFDTTGDYSEELAEFYEHYIMAMDPDEGNGDCSALGLSEEYAAGLHALLARLKAEGKKYPYLKVHVTGPVSFALSAVDQDKRSIYYNEEFRDVAVKAIAMKCRWQIQQFKPFAENIICFIDEPILSAFGSSTYVSVKREDVVAYLNEVIEAVHMDGGIAGVHCCGNTEWSILVDAGVDIVNFDAFDYGETIAMYPQAVNELFARDGALAWGLSPSSPKVMDVDADALVEHFDKLVDGLAAAGVSKDEILEKAIITSSCGTGSLTVDVAEEVFKRIGECSAALQAKYGK